jgi:cysteine-rich repeat protein
MKLRTTTLLRTAQIAALLWVLVTGLLVAMSRPTGAQVSVCETDEDCNDGNACNGEEVCADSVCTYGLVPILCDDFDLCTQDACDPETGACSFIPLVCDDHDPCTVDACDPDTETGGCRYTPVACDDHNPCTVDQCEPELGCTLRPIQCTDDGDPCTMDRCDPSSGACVHEPGLCVPSPTPVPTPCAPGLLRDADDYLFLLEKRAILKTGTLIQGNVGVNKPGGTLKLGRGAVLDIGTRAAADRALLRADAQVFDLFANTVRRDEERATIAGTLISPVAPPVYFTQPLVVPDPFDPANFPPVFPIGCGGPARFGEVGQGITLPPGSYSRVIVGREGKLTLGPGSYQFCELRAVRSAIEVTGPATLNVRDRFTLGNDSRLEPIGNTSPADVQINLMGRTTVKIGQQSIFRARLFAPDALVRIGREALVTGHIVAEELRSDPGFRAPGCGDGAVECGETCDPPGLPAGPNGNLCRRDCTLCGDGRVQPGEECDDGNAVDGDACDDHCRTNAGACGGTRLTLTTMASNLALGFSGFFHGVHVPALTTLALGVACAGTDCAIQGSSVVGSPFISPLPLSAGGVAICAVTTFDAPPTGTFACGTGCGTLHLPLTSSLFLSPALDQPCPLCVGDPVPGDGQRGGICAGGATPGAPCDAGGVTLPFGVTSTDCMPSGSPVDTFPLALTLTTGAATLPGGVDCAGSGYPPGSCQCPGQLAPNICADGICSAPGYCAAGPLDGRCSDAPFRQCSPGSGATDCEDVIPGAGLCVAGSQSCFAGSAITRVGMCDPQNPRFVAVACLPRSAAPVINFAVGLPGPEALELSTAASIQ